MIFFPTTKFKTHPNYTTMVKIFRPERNMIDSPQPSTSTFSAVSNFFSQILDEDECTSSHSSYEPSSDESSEGRFIAPKSVKVDVNSTLNGENAAPSQQPTASSLENLFTEKLEIIDGNSLEAKKNSVPQVNYQTNHKLVKERNKSESTWKNFAISNNTNSPWHRHWFHYFVVEKTFSFPIAEFLIVRRLGDMDGIPEFQF